MTDDIIFGFSTGAFHRTLRARDSISVIREVGCRALELGFVALNRIEAGELDDIRVADLDGFDYVSLHAPVFPYKKDKATFDLFKKIERIDRERKLDIVVVHPDTVEDFSVFAETDLKVGIENMDHRKKSGKSPEDILGILRADPDFEMVLDVNHIYTIDPTMQLAASFYESMGQHILEVQLSGYSDLHDPLFETSQEEIVAAIRDFSVPLIDECTFSAEADPLQAAKLEKEYVYSIIEKVIAERR